MWVNYAPGVSCVYACLCVCTHTCPCMPQEHSSCVASSQTSVSQTIMVAELCEEIGLTLDARTLGQCSGRHFMLKHNYVQTLQSDVAHCTGRYWTSLGEISLAVVDCWLYYAVPTHWILLSLVWNHTFAAVRALENYDTSTTSLKPVLNVINNLLGAKEVTVGERIVKLDFYLWQWLQSIAETCIYNLNWKKTINNYK